MTDRYYSETYGEEYYIFDSCDSDYNVVKGYKHKKGIVIRKGDE